MSTKHAIVMLSLATLVLSTMACMSESIQLETGGDDVDAEQKAQDDEACHEASRELAAMGCPKGLLFHAQWGGDPIVATSIEDAGMPVCGGLGRLVDAEDIEDPDWVGSHIFQTSSCIVGCFVPECGRPSDACMVGFASGGFCTNYCRDGIDEQRCRSLVMECNGIEPDDVDPEDEACGLELGGDDGGGSEIMPGG